MSRTIALLIVIIAATILPWWAWALTVSLYVVWFEGIELIVVAAALDAYFGFSHGLPLYTVAAAFVTIGVLILRPYLSIAEAG